MIGLLVVRVSRAFAPIVRPLLRQYILHGGPVPERARWIQLSLERDLVPHPSVRVVSFRRGLRLEVDLANPMGQAVYYRGAHEPALADFLERTLRPGMTVIDVGANIGEVSVLASALVSPGGRVVAVEVSPTTLPRLKRNLALNGARNVDVVESAVADVDGHVPFHLGLGTDSGSSSMSPPHDFTGEILQVPAVRLDSLVSSLGLVVDVVKLDIEGAEYAALRGFRECMTGAHPPIVVFEYHADVAGRMGWNLDDLTRYLTACGYSITESLDVGAGRENLVARPAGR